MNKKQKKIGFTTSLPIEVILAAGHIPVDLNNLFISDNPVIKTLAAEKKGFPRTICSWIKGIYEVAKSGAVDEVIGLTMGDCSNTQSLLAMLHDNSIPVWGFAFPSDKDYQAMVSEISKLEEHYQVSREDVLRVKNRLDRIRKKLLILDEWTWKENIVSGLENHTWLISSSDFWGNPDAYEEALDSFMENAKSRKPSPIRLRLAYIGVPPILLDLYQTVHNLGGEIIYNEVQRQFSMPAIHEDIVQQYLDYTYPYSVFDRIKDITTEIKRRDIEAVFSYTQAFCHLQIDNILLRKYIKLPFLTLEGDQPAEVDSRTLLRIESFMEIHAENKQG